jgi:hypothetical protein
MDRHEQRIHRLDRFQKPDRRGRVDGFNVDRRGLPGLQINRAMDVEARAPAGLLDRQVFSGRRPAAHGSRRVRWMHRVHEQRGLDRAKRIQQIVVGLDERPMLFRVQGDLLKSQPT